MLAGSNLSEYGIEDSEFRLAQARCMQQPVQEALRFLGIAQSQQRANSQRGIPQPAIAVVPVEAAADSFRQ